MPHRAQVPLCTALTLVLTVPLFTVHAQAADPVHHGSNPTVSPDGKWIAFSSDREGSVDIYLIGADGSGLTRLTTDGNHHDRPYWSRDGKQLLLTPSAKDTVRLLALTIANRSIRQLGRFAAKTGTPAPEGSWVVLGSGDWTSMQLSAATLDGSPPRRLTNDRAAYWCPAISPRGDVIAASRQDSTGLQVWLVAANGSGVRALTHFSKESGSPQCAAFSTDGRKVAVQAESGATQSKPGIGRIWVVDVTSGQATRLGPADGAYRDELPQWFPDGGRIAFQSDRTGQWEVWVMNSDGTGQRQLTK